MSTCPVLCGTPAALLSSTPPIPSRVTGNVCCHPPPPTTVLRHCPYRLSPDPFFDHRRRSRDWRGSLIHAPARQAHQGEGEGERAGWACAICNAIPADSPHLSSCTHVFCYVCLRTAQASGHTLQGRSVCPQCSSFLTFCKRLQHPILRNMQQL